MSYTTGYRRGRGIFSAAGGLGQNPYKAHGLFGFGRDFRGLFGLGQVKTGATQPDHTASDWATALTTGGSLVSSIVGAATGQQTATTPATTTPAIDPATAIAPPVSASPDWYWPVVIGVGVAVLGGIAYMSYNVKGPVKANRYRVRRNKHRSRKARYRSAA